MVLLIKKTFQYNHLEQIEGVFEKEILDQYEDAQFAQKLCDHFNSLGDHRVLYEVEEI